MVSVSLVEKGANALYIAGFIDGTGTTNRGACLPSKLSVEQVVSPYVAYMLKHPEAMHTDRRIGLVLALADTFPCPINNGLAKYIYAI